MNHYVINIGRQLGSGGKQIAERLAKELGVNCYDKKLLSLAARESGMDVNLFKEKDENKGFLQNLLHGRLVAFNPLDSDNLYENILSDESIFKIQSDTICHLAENEDCIFLGRCADYILRDHPRMFNIFISANEEDRLRNIAFRNGITLAQASQIMNREDIKRSKYYNFYTGKVWGAAASYDLCVNISRTGEDAAFQMILDYVRKVLSL